MAGFRNDTVYGSNVDFSGATIPSPQVTADGQLLIGSTAAPNIRVATLTSTGGTVTITNGAGTINLEAVDSGTSTFNGDTGSATGDTISLLAFDATNKAGYSVTTVASGSQVLFGNTDANSNIYFGSGTGVSTAGGSTANVIIGTSGGVSITSAQANMGLGSSVMQGLTTGSFNTCMGYEAGIGFTTGTYNLLLGAGSGSNYSTNESSNICINSAATVGESNTLRIGSGTGAANQQLSSAYISGIDGVDVGSVATVVTMASDQLGTADITAGAGITVIPSSNAITISSTGGVSWQTVAINTALSVNNGYICIAPGGALLLTLPVASAVGEILEVTLDGATSWRIVQGAGQAIRFSSSTTTTGAGGYLESTAQGDSLRMVCTVANTTWRVLSSIGNITVV